MKFFRTIFSIFLVSVSGVTLATSLYVDPAGNVGVGTDVPLDKLHVVDGNLQVEQSQAGVAGRIEFKTAGGWWQINQNANTGRLTFVAPDYPGAPFKFQPGAVDNLFRVGVVAPDVVDINGDLLVNGVFVPDYVFEDEYKLPTIEEQAEFMFSNKHLPSVQKAGEDYKSNVNVMANQMAMLEELEKAHIYISQLNTSIKELQAELEALKAAN